MTTMGAPPIQRMPGNGFITRVYRNNPNAVRRHLRRRYREGVQMAFQYFECDATIREGLNRLAQSLARRLYQSHNGAHD
jgi:hypothetical protein